MKEKRIFLFAPWFMGVLFIVFAMVMAFATFYENDFGPKAARALVYETKWFELLMILLVVNLIGQIIHYKLYKRKKLTILFFHLAFILMIIGAGITRYFGFEGVVHIRENHTQNICFSLDNYLNVKVTNINNDDVYSNFEELNLSQVSIKYKSKFDIGNDKYSLKLVDYIPNAVETIVNDLSGEPMVSLILSKGMMFREKVFLSKGDIKQAGGLLIGFSENDSVNVRITFKDNSFYITSNHKVSESSMMSNNTLNYDQGEVVPLERMKIYEVKGVKIVPEIINKKGKIKVVNTDRNLQHNRKSALVFELESNDELKEINLWLGQNLKNKSEISINDYKLELNYGPLEIQLPFKLKLEDFILERYPGSNNPSSYKSNIVLIDEMEGVNMPYSIYMNHILKYKGWRFYQSSYDKDERGTILSVNKDFWGMIVTYVGYAFLFTFIVLSMLNKNSKFWTVNKSFFKSTSAKTIALIFLFLGITFNARSQEQKFVVEKVQADKFGKILVQDQKGRTKPLYTLSNDILRKLARETGLNGFSPMQVFLGLYFDFENWQDVPLIKVSNSEIKKMIGIRENYAAFSEIVDLHTNTYKLKQSFNAAHAKPAGARNKFDKEIIKINERVNICYMVYTGEFLKIFPVNDPNNKWFSPKDAFTFAKSSDDSLYLKNIINLYSQSILSSDFERADEYLNSIIDYQRKFAQYELPSERKVRAEILYYKSKLYDRLFPFYATVGILLLFILIYSIIAHKKDLSKLTKVFTILLIIGFLFHTLGLGIRWYVSGHAPMSNGYESMIFISWVTILAGFVFVRRSAFVLAATSVLGGFTLMVAHLSFMDPEITNLVPVLQSYWLTLHVSVITGSYGFFGLGAIIGIIVLILYSLSTERNKANIESTIEELTVINYKSLTIGLYLLTIGTFVGAIWANESWGRYWGWDPKETWSLITIIVYSFVIHSGMIKGLKGFYTFNVLALFAFSSVLMTYFGVNYYLSGLHSYAGGDPVPVPKFVYISVIMLIILSLYAYINRGKYNLE